MDRLKLLRDRVAVLEDALAKSETDRAATYLKGDQLQRELQSMQEEKLALMHEYHDASHGPVAEATMMLHAAQEDNQRLRHQLTILSEKYDEEVPKLRSVVREQELELKRLRKLAKSGRDERQDAAAIAELQYTNERISAQLAKLQAPPPPPVFDEVKFKELEQSVLSLTSELTSLEAKMARTKSLHEAEKRELRLTLETQQREFVVEREECDRVVHMMASKLEALLDENQMLRGFPGSASAQQQSQVSHTMRGTYPAASTPLPTNTGGGPMMTPLGNHVPVRRNATATMRR